MIMIVLTIVTMVLMRKISLTATCLLIPYVIWLCFAGYLNGYIMVMNK
jgi:tryptophan-rich sensory protein